MKLLHSLLNGFQKRHTATEAIKNICNVFPDAVKARKYYLLLKRFKDGDCNIFNKPRYERRRTLILLIHSQSIGHLAHEFNVSRSTINGHLKQMWKTCREGILVFDKLTLKK